MTTNNEANQAEGSAHSTGGAYFQESKDSSRDTRCINNRIVKTGRDVGEGIKAWPVKAGHYHLITTHAYP